MRKFLSTSLLSPLLIALTVWIAAATPTRANPNRNQSNPVTPQTIASATNPVATAIGTEPTAAQINQATTSIEVKPGDWAYQTLQSLNTKYGCSDMPTGNRSLSREEFATSLNGCVQSVEELVARRKPRKAIKKRRVAPPVIFTPPSSTRDNTPPPPPQTTPVAPPAPPEVSQQDLDQLKQLVQSFGAEMQAVDARIKALNSRIADVKDKSFSTTTKLVGEAIFAVTGLEGGPTNATRNTIFSDRVRLAFRSSFTGKDLLVVRLQSRNSNSFAGSVAGSAAKTNMVRLGFEGSDENATTLQRLQYQVPLSSSSKVFIESVGSEFNDNYYTFNPEHQAAGTGAVTRFGRFNPVYRLSGEGAAMGVDYKISPDLGLVLSYAVPNGVNDVTTGGLFNGSNVLFSQVTVKPAEDVNLGLIYARSYHAGGAGISGNNGSNIANRPFGTTPTSANHYSLAASVNLSKDLILSAWGGVTQATREAQGGGNAEIWNYAATLAAKDFGAPGSTLGFVVGMQPKVTSNSSTNGSINAGTSLHLETFYKYKLSNNLTITPGLLMLTNPEHNAANPTEYLGTIRSTFSF